MSISKLIAKHITEVHFGGNWTWANLQDVLKDVTLQQATTKVDSFNTIAALVFHINYYIVAVTKVLQGGELTSKDSESFAHPPLASETDWEQMKERVWSDVKTFTALVEALPDEKMHELFVAEKYGNYFRNLMGISEHFHYHLGQIVILKKLISQQ
jgi:hypothetical protein